MNRWVVLDLVLLSDDTDQNRFFLFESLCGAAPPGECLFVEGPHKTAALGSAEDAHNGTWVGSMGVKINGQEVQVDSDD